MPKFKKILSFTLLLFAAFSLTACRESSRASYNVSREADNFNITRKITVINAIKGDIMYQVTGRMSIQDEGDQLVIVAKDDDGEYKKHFIGLSDNVSYIVEDVTGVKGIGTQYRLIFNPEMIIPIEVTTAD